MTGFVFACRTVLLILVALVLAEHHLARGQGEDDTEQSGKPSFEVNATALPRGTAWQRDLYEWLRTIAIDDVELPPAKISWDGYYRGNTDQLANLWLQSGAAKEAASLVVKAHPRWFVLDDGKGDGIEGAGNIKQLRWGNQAALLYQLDLPLQNGGQGNPFYQNRALGLRALVATATDMMMLQLCMEQVDFFRRSDFLGGSMNGWLYTYTACKDLLDAKTRHAFEACFDEMMDDFLQWGPRDVTPNMDMRAVAAVGKLYAAVEYPAMKDKAVRVARRFLFGAEDGSLAKLDSKRGTFYPAGYIGENESPETTYNGVSLYYLTEARAATLGSPDWDFLDDVLELMIDFKLYQYFPDPDGYVDGPAGYAGRTGDSYVYDQRGPVWRNLTCAATYLVGRPLARPVKSKQPTSVLSPAAMVTEIQRSIENINRRNSLAADETLAPAVWIGDHAERWPPDCPYFPAGGWHDRLSELFAVNGDQEQTTLVPFAREGVDFSKPFGEAGKEEFWAYRGHDGARSFGFFVEHVPRAWPYASWAGGSLQAFWTEKTGLLVLTRHDKSSYNWSRIDQWGTEHIWGKTAAGKAFTTSTSFHMRPPHVNGDFTGARPWVEVSTVFGCENDMELTGQTAVTGRFEALENGIRITRTIEGDGKDQISELWATIPVNLRNAQSQSRLADTAIEFFDGMEWKRLDTVLVQTAAIRLGRDFGHGAQYGYIAFPRVQRVKLSAQSWQASYQSSTRLRNIHIDLHGNPGTAAPMPARVTLMYEITTSAPKLK